MGYIGEYITDGRWQKIEYDSIPDYCFYCKHQGHKEEDYIVKKRDEENKKEKTRKKTILGKTMFKLFIQRCRLPKIWKLIEGRCITINKGIQQLKLNSRVYWMNGRHKEEEIIINKLDSTQTRLSFNYINLKQVWFLSLQKIHTLIWKYRNLQLMEVEWRKILSKYMHKGINKMLL